ncbi:MAG: GH32 C-terminal domain-containing protein, partial [Clostridiaceae bacterium]|nr:GH32 C-terminal domain-containing protein [Clostridiaceae bacterium]MDY5890046.1 GH32 C-terminal domain-containing protein [Oscillospiraceae bacterium]
RRDVVSQRKMKIDNPQSTLKLRLILDKYSAELFVNDGYQTFSATFYTPLEADEIVFKCDGKAILNIEKSDIRI